MSQSLKSSPKSSVSSTTPPGVAQGFIFVIAMWLLSRLVIVVAMQLIAPLYHNPPVYYAPPGHLGFIQGFVPKTGWEIFSHWDGAWYRKIATIGYDYADDLQKHSIAFFPLFPLLSRGLMTFGLPFDQSGVLVNNLAFLGALLLVYRWIEEHHDINSARWATAVLAWCPFSLFGTVIYTEGLFLLLSTAALRAFDKHQHGWAALWGAMATATRITGAAIVPAFLLVAWREKRPAIAYAAGLAASGGLVLFSLYCAIEFQDPLAFVHAQKAWNNPNNYFSGWLDTFVNIFMLKSGYLKAIRDLSQIIMFFGGGYLLWHFRTKLARVAVVYGFCSLALVLSSGAVMSLGRYAYGIVSLSLAFSLLLARHPRWGYITMGLFAVLLVRFAIYFSWWRWVA